MIIYHIQRSNWKWNDNAECVYTAPSFSHLHYDTIFDMLKISKCDRNKVSWGFHHMDLLDMGDDKLTSPIELSKYPYDRLLLLDVPDEDIFGYSGYWEWIDVCLVQMTIDGTKDKLKEDWKTEYLKEKMSNLFYSISNGVSTINDTQILFKLKKSHIVKELTVDEFNKGIHGAYININKHITL